MGETAAGADCTGAPAAGRGGRAEIVLSPVDFAVGGTCFASAAARCSTGAGFAFAAAGGADVRLAEALAVILAAMRCAPFPGFVSSAFAGARTGALAATGLAAMVLAAMVLAATGLAATGLAAAVCALALTGARAEVLATALVVFPAALPAALLAALAPSPARAELCALLAVREAPALSVVVLAALGAGLLLVALRAGVLAADFAAARGAAVVLTRAAEAFAFPSLRVAALTSLPESLVDLAALDLAVLDLAFLRAALSALLDFLAVDMPAYSCSSRLDPGPAAARYAGRLRGASPNAPPPVERFRQEIRNPAAHDRAQPETGKASTPEKTRRDQLCL